MKYKLLKLVSNEQNPNAIGHIFNSNGKNMCINNGLRIPVELLIEQGFIEEVTETPKPRWKVGDYVVTSSGNEYIKVHSVNLVASGHFLYNKYLEESLRDPTPEELSTYFR